MLWLWVFFIFYLWVKYLRVVCVYFNTSIHRNYSFAHSKLVSFFLIFLPFTWQARLSSHDGNQLCINLWFLILISYYWCICNALIRVLWLLRDSHVSELSEGTPTRFLSSAWPPILIIIEEIYDLQDSYPSDISERNWWKSYCGDKQESGGRHRQYDHMHFIS